MDKIPHYGAQRTIRGRCCFILPCGAQGSNSSFGFGGKAFLLTELSLHYEFPLLEIPL